MRTEERNEPSRPWVSSSSRRAGRRGRGRRGRRGSRRHRRRPGRRGSRRRLAAAALTASAATAAAVVVAAARVDDRLDVADRGGGEAHPGGEDRVAGLVALGLLGAHRRPLHRLAVVAPLGLQRLAHGLGAADALDRRDQARLRARRAARRRGRRGGRLLLGAAAAPRRRAGLALGGRLGGRLLAAGSGSGSLASTAACSCLRSSLSLAKNVRRCFSAAVSRRRRRGLLAWPPRPWRCGAALGGWRGAAGGSRGGRLPRRAAQRRALGGAPRRRAAGAAGSAGAARRRARRRAGAALGGAALKASAAAGSGARRGGGLGAASRRRCSAGAARRPALTDASAAGSGAPRRPAPRARSAARLRRALGGRLRRRRGGRLGAARRACRPRPPGRLAVALGARRLGLLGLGRRLALLGQHGPASIAARGHNAGRRATRSFDNGHRSAGGATRNRRTPRAPRVAARLLAFEAAWPRPTETPRASCS